MLEFIPVLFIGMPFFLCGIVMVLWGLELITRNDDFGDLGIVFAGATLVSLPFSIIGFVIANYLVKEV